LSNQHLIDPPLGNERILIVEDTPAVRKLAQRMLTSLGYDVTVASNADEAIHILQSQIFDVLFTDIVMPGSIDGIALAKVVRVGHPDIKIIFTSGFSEMSPADIEELNAVYVTKPYRKLEIAIVLRNMIDR
jgi:CheY-like chemotaxis protein